MCLPVLLDLPAPHLRAYARETVIAEKFQAMVAFGHANSHRAVRRTKYQVPGAKNFELLMIARPRLTRDDRCARSTISSLERAIARAKAGTS